jgi:hypothetical protein
MGCSYVFRYKKIVQDTYCIFNCFLRNFSSEISHRYNKEIYKTLYFLSTYNTRKRYSPWMVCNNLLHYILLPFTPMVYNNIVILLQSVVRVATLRTCCANGNAICNKEIFFTYRASSDIPFFQRPLSRKTTPFCTIRKRYCILVPTRVQRGHTCTYGVQYF